MSVDPAVVNIVEAMRASGAPALHEVAPDQARRAMSRTPGPGPEVRESFDVTLSSADGGEFLVRVLKPTEHPAGVVLYVHGGGWVLGSLNTSDHLARKIAVDSGWTVVVVDYRLAPEHPYPAALEDTWAALQWAGSRVAELATPAAPLAVVGDSSGGNLATLSVLRSRDRGGPVVDLQYLLYPVTDADFDRPSFLDPENQLILTRDTMMWFWDHYLPDRARRTDPDVSPLRAPDLSGLPRTVIGIAEYDVLRDECEAYAKRLSEAGVDVHTHRFDGQTHGFFSMVGVLPGHETALRHLTGALADTSSRDVRRG